MAVDTGEVVYERASWEAVERRDLRLRGARRPRTRGWLVRRMLLAADVAGLAIAFEVALHLYGGGIDGRAQLLLLLPALPAWVVAAYFVEKL